MLQRFGICFAFVLCFALPSQAAVLVVNCNPGPGQFPDINAAVAASSPGDTIAVEDCGSPYAGFGISGANELHLVGMEKLGAASGEGVYNNLYPKVIVSEPGGPCAEIKSSSNVSVHGLSFESCGGEGLLITNSYGIVIEGNRIKDTRGVGIAAAGSQLSITGNHIYIPHREGIHLEDVQVTQISDNHIEAADGDGIFVTGGWYVKIFSNLITSSNDAGIELLDGAEHRVELNTIQGSATDDMLCNNTADPDFISNNYATFTDNCGSDVYP